MRILDTRSEMGETGPVIGVVSACAEAKIEENGKNKWVAVIWLTEAPESLQINITEKSIFSFVTGIPDKDENGNEIEIDYINPDLGDEYLIDGIEDYNGPYPELILQLMEMLGSTLDSAGYISCEQFEFREDVWPWLSDAGVGFDLPSDEDE